jgi:aerobic carbon-monoxide dehydrogenase medium subunit
VRPPPFEHVEASSVDEAVALLVEHGDEAKVLAGGQSLVPLLALRLARPTVLVDIGRIRELAGVDLAGTGLSIGAMTTQRVVERDPRTAATVPLLAQALPWIAHTAIRNAGTFGGSLAHADPAAEIPTVALATDATVVVRGPAGERRIAAADLFGGFFTTTIEPEEVVVRVEVPAAPNRSGSAFEEVARRHGDFALAAIAAVVALGTDGAVTHARIVATAVAPTPLRCHDAEAALLGRVPDDAAIADAAAAVQAAVDPADDVHATAAYRRHVSGVLTRRALTRALATARTTVVAA